MPAAELLEVKDLTVRFNLPRQNTLFCGRAATVTAVDGISFSLPAGAVLGVVGESGCGKSTLARAIIGLTSYQSGQVCLNGKNLKTLTGRALKQQRRAMHMIFQDPLASLDPRMTLGAVIAEPLAVYEPHLTAAERRHRVAAMLEAVGINAAMINRYPHEFSGGQCQRIGIARSLIIKPRLLICDEPTTALDMTVQAQIITLLRAVNRDFNTAILLITHDFRVVAGLCDQVLVMHHGRRVEFGATLDIFRTPRTDYTRKLLSAVPRLLD